MSHNTHWAAGSRVRGPWERWFLRGGVPTSVDIPIQQAPMGTSSVTSSLAAGNAEWDLSVLGCQERPSLGGSGIQMINKQTYQ